MKPVQFTTVVKNGVIEIPEELCLPGECTVRVTLDVRDANEEFDMIEYLFRHPIEGKDFRPMTRDEAHARD